MITSWLIEILPNAHHIILYIVTVNLLASNDATIEDTVDNTKIDCP